MARLLVLFLILAYGRPADAALLAYEPFANAAGTPVIGSADGFGFSGAWLDYNSSQGVATNTAIGLAYTDVSGRTLLTSGGAGFFQGLTTANNSMQTIRLFSFSRDTEGATTWISFLAVRQGPSVAGGNPYPRGANVPHDMHAGNVQKLAVGNSTGAAGNTVALIPEGSANNIQPSGIIFSQPNFIVVRIDHVGGGNDNAYLFVNPALNREPSPAEADATSLGAFDFSFDRVRVFAGGNDSGNSRPYAELIIDEYRLGETYADVTPHLDPPSLVITNATLNSGEILMFGAGGSNGVAFHLLSSSSVSATSAVWSVIATNHFGANGAFVLTQPVADGVREQFFRLRIPAPMIAPSMVSEPADLTVTEGNDAEFAVTAGGSPVLQYQWYVTPSTPLPDATNAGYVVTNAQTNHAGGYFVIVTNDYGAITSRVATLTVNPPTVLVPGAYFVSPAGRDTQDGSEANPFGTIAMGLDAIGTGGTLYLRGGTYAQPSRLSLDREAATHGAIRMWAYPGESPVIDSSGNSSDGIRVSGTGYHLKGLTVMNAGHNGINISGHYNTIEMCTVHDNGNTGLHITGGSSGTTFPSHNLVLNCDAYLNYDPPIGGNADGFSAKWDLGPGNVFRGCRAWLNSDDAWDLWMGNAAVLIEDCWAFRSGVNVWNSPEFNGNGNGFKLGGNYVGAPHRLLRCLAFENAVNGIDQNNNIDGQTIDQNTSWNNGSRNYSLNHGANTTPHLVRNNVSFAGGNGDAFTAGTILDNNSWQVIPPPPVNEADVLSVDSSVATAPRNPDGSLPEWPFLRPVSSGRLVDQGIDIGEPYFGSAPDLGAFESAP